MENNPVVRFLKGIKDMSFNTWMMYSVYNYLVYSGKQSLRLTLMIIVFFPLLVIKKFLIR